MVHCESGFCYKLLTAEIYLLLKASHHTVQQVSKRVLEKFELIPKSVFMYWLLLKYHVYYSVNLNKGKILFRHTYVHTHRCFFEQRQQQQQFICMRFRGIILYCVYLFTRLDFAFKRGNHIYTYRESVVLYLMCAVVALEQQQTTLNQDKCVQTHRHKF